MRKGIIAIIVAGTGVFVGGYTVGRVARKLLFQMQGQLDKITRYYKLLDKWLMTRQRGKGVNEYFERRNYKRVAIYGMKELGQRLFDELRETEIETICIIDKNAKEIHSDIKVVAPEEKIPKVDIIVVTAFYYFGSINKELSARVNCPVISLEEIFDEINIE